MKESTDEGVTATQHFNRLSDVKERSQCENARRSIVRSENDWAYFREQGHLPLLRLMMRRASNSAVADCAKFVSCDANRQITATGTKHVRLKNANTVQLAKIEWKMCRKQKARDYVAQEQFDTIGRSTFMKMIAMLTSGQQTIKQ